MSLVSVPRSVFINASKKMKDKHILSNENFNDTQNYENISTHVAANVHTRQLNPNLSEAEWVSYNKAVRNNPTSKLYYH